MRPGQLNAWHSWDESPKRDNVLMHHGIDGQRWGVKHGPPYPLDREDHNRVVRKEQQKHVARSAAVGGAAGAIAGGIVGGPIGALASAGASALLSATKASIHNHQDNKARKAREEQRQKEETAGPIREPNAWKVGKKNETKIINHVKKQMADRPWIKDGGEIKLNEADIERTGDTDYQFTLYNNHGWFTVYGKMENGVLKLKKNVEFDD